MNNTIVFFPGWSGLPKQSYNPLLKRFEADGYETITIPYRLGGTGSIKKTAKDSDQWLWWNSDFTSCSADKAIFIGHSMGGLVSRYMVQKLNWEPGAYISIGTPHEGLNYVSSRLPKWGPLVSASQMSSRSGLMSSLRPLEWPQIPSMTIEAQYDLLVPNGRLDAIERNVKIPWTEHASVLWSERTYLEIWAFLNYELTLESGSGT